MNLFDGDRERHVPGRTPRLPRTGLSGTTIKAVTPGYRQRVTLSVRNGNYARMGLRKLFGDKS